MEQNIYSGMPMRYLGNGLMVVWIYLKGPIPLGMAKWMYANTGSNIDGDNLILTEGAAFVCSLTSEVGPGGFWDAMDDKGASYFGNGYREGDKIPFYPANIDSKGRDNFVAKRVPPLPNTMQMPQSLGASEYHAAFTLQPIGGEPLPSFTNVPKGKFSIPSKGHRVLVAFYDYNIQPAIIRTLPYQEEYANTVDKVK